MFKKIIILGAGGHAKVIADIALKCGYEVLGFLDDNADVKESGGIRVLGPIADCVKYSDCEFVIGIGNNLTRKAISDKFPLNWATVIHPSAQIGFDVKIECGTVVMANAVINPSARIGKHCIINTASVVEHDSEIGNYVHLSPKGLLCGTVKIGDNTNIGAGATVINNISICSDSVIGAGATVIDDINEQGIYVGTPAKKLLR